MRLSHSTTLLPLRTVVAVVAMLGLGACSRSQHLTDSVAGPGRSGAGTEAVVGCPTLVGNTLNTATPFSAEMGIVASLTTRRLRIETSGDIAVPSIASMGPCAAADIPTINFIGGHANVFVGGTTASVTTSGNRLSFGSLLFPGTGLEPGVVLASDAQGNVLQILWPDLAGLGTGSPVVRVQLAAWNTALVNSAATLDVTWDMVVTQNGVQQFIKGQCQGIPTNGTPVIAGGAAIAPCPATLGAGGTLTNALAGIVQFRAKRLRFEITGDVASGAINAAGACAASDAPTIRFTGGTGDMTQAGSNTSVTPTGRPLAFGPLLFPGMLLEPGVVIAADADKNVLQIIWPGLAGLPAGPPILRFQLTRWSPWILPGRKVDVSLRINAIGPDGAPASFLGTARSVVIPQQR